MTPFDTFRNRVELDPPRAAVVLGSGLSPASAPLHSLASIAYADITGLVPPSVAGHKGKLEYGTWNGVPTLVCSGRTHFYEGQAWDRVTALVRLVFELGARRIILTNAAGGIRDDLNPGDLMAMTGHWKLLNSESWQHRKFTTAPYTLLAPNLPQGVYAALTGPCYETPAEIRALKALGCDAVGMSTAMEAEAAFALGMQVAGISCITNKAAGLGSGTLSHHEVEITAKTAVLRLGAILGSMIAECGLRNAE